MKRATGRVGLNILIWAGSAVLAGSGVLHFHLWDSEGYRQIPISAPCSWLRPSSAWRSEWLPPFFAG